MKKSELYKYVLDYFRGIHPEVTTELEFGSVFQLLVAVVLSAQCTDKRVNQVTPELFAHYPDARSMAEADEFEVYEYVKSVSYPNAKALPPRRTRPHDTERIRGRGAARLRQSAALAGRRAKDS